MDGCSQGARGKGASRIELQGDKQSLDQRRFQFMEWFEFNRALKSSGCTGSMEENLWYLYSAGAKVGADVCVGMAEGDIYPPGQWCNQLLKQHLLLHWVLLSSCSQGTVKPFVLLFCFLAPFVSLAPCEGVSAATGERVAMVRRPRECCFWSHYHIRIEAPRSEQGGEMGAPAGKKGKTEDLWEE